MTSVKEKEKEIIHLQMGGIRIYVMGMNERGTHYEGTLRLPDSKREERIQLLWKNEGKERVKQFACSDSHIAHLFQSNSQFSEPLKHSVSPRDFFSQFQNILSKLYLLSSTSSLSNHSSPFSSSSSSSSSFFEMKSGLLDVSFYKTMMTSFQKIGLERVVSMDMEERKLVLLLRDESQRTHELAIHFPLEYPKKPPTRYMIALPSSSQQKRKAPLLFGTRSQAVSSSKRERETDATSQRSAGGCPPLIVNDEGLEVTLYGRETSDVNQKLRYCRDVETMVEIFEEELAVYQAFWKVVEDFDQQTWVLDPPPLPFHHSDKHDEKEMENDPERKSEASTSITTSKIEKRNMRSRSATMRRIALGKHCSLQVGIDARNPFAIPEIRLLGPESRIASFRQLLTANSHLWDYQQLPRINLELIFASSFPSPPRQFSSSNHAKRDFEIECGICYAYRFDETLSSSASTSSSLNSSAIPECSCDNEKCSAIFHRFCLHEWLRSVPTSHTSYSTTYGNCPYCSDTIHVSN